MTRITSLTLPLLTLALVGCTGLVGDDSGGGGGPTFATDHPRIYLERNRDRLVAALDAEQPAAVRFRDMVDRQVDGADFYEFQAWNAALMGQLTGEARYCDLAVAQVDAWVTGEEQRIGDGSVATVAADSYLYIGERIGDLALTYDWCFDATSDSQRRRWLSYAEQAVWNVWNYQDATWGGQTSPWSGWSVDNPSNNYYYSFLRATMLLGLAARGEMPEAQGWIDLFRDDKIGGELVPTFNRDLVGGGSREGTGYGVSMRSLWELYDLWQGSTGEDIAELTPHTRASLVEFLHTILPTLDRVAPLGDHSRDSTAALFDYHRHYLEGLARLLPDDVAAREAMYQLGRSTVDQMGSQFMYAYDFLDDPIEVGEQEPALNTAFYGPGTGQIFARSSWATDATWFATLAGAYSEPHAHHDQSAFLLYKGEWLAYDANIASQSGIHAEADVHNLVRFSKDGETVPMALGNAAELVALHQGPGYLHTAIDVTPVYKSGAGIVRHQREMVYLEPDVLVVFDRVDGGGATATWQLNSPIQPTVAGARATFTGQTSSLTVDRVIPATATVDVRTWNQLDSDVNSGYRLDVSGGDGIFLHVLGVDGAVQSVTPSDGTGTLGVDITMTGGSATVRFSPTGVAGSLVIRDGGGATVTDVALDAAVESLAER